jgi:hypothetical protein
MITKFLALTGLQKEEDRRLKLYNDLIKHEARIGGELFGPVPKNGRRDFFCLDPYTWIWYEEWVDAHGNRQSRTTRYEVRPEGIMKIRDGKKYHLISDEEAARLYDAAKEYQRRVHNEIYNFA